MQIVHFVESGKNNLSEFVHCDWKRTIAVYTMTVQSIRTNFVLQCYQRPRSDVGRFIGSKHNNVARNRFNRGSFSVKAGNDAMDSWLDLASFVASTSAVKSPYEELADAIGKDCYVDIAGWHLFLKDIKVEGNASLAQALSLVLGPKIAANGFDQRDVEDAVAKVPIKLGQGKTTLSLAQVMPAMCVSDLVDVCEEFARNL